MRRYFTLTLLFFFLFAISLPAQTSNDTWSVKFSNGLLYRYQPNINALTGKGWEYSNTIITHGMEKVYNNVTDSVQYLNYIKTYVDAYVNGSGVISATVNSLDRTHPGISCLFLYEKTGLLKYKTAATTLRNMYVGASATYPKTALGGIFWHKNNGSYNDIILIDGIYMLHPFLAKYGSMFGDNAAIDTAVNQTLYIFNQLYDNTTHLIKHAWNPTKTQAWANAVTGNSSEVWSRGMGWFTMALVDILKYVPASHPRRGELITALANLAIGIQTYQDPSTGLWYQVVDKGTSLTNNYLETSGSAMFVYAMKTASDSGWIAASYATVAENAWNYFKDVTNARIDIYADGYPRINGFAPAMSVQTSAANYVQASLQPVSCPGTTHPHGYAAILMAASAMEFPINTVLPLRFLNFNAVRSSGRVNLFWENNDDAAVDHYEVQRSTDGARFSNAAVVPSDGSSKYTWTDYSTEQGTVYYRIRAVANNGPAIFSRMIALNPAGNGSASAISIVPNPVKNKTVNIFLDNVNEGNYSLRVISVNGNLVSEKHVVILNKSTMNEKMILPAASPGVYYLVIEGMGIRKRKTIFID